MNKSILILSDDKHLDKNGRELIDKCYKMLKNKYDIYALKNTDNITYDFDYCIANCEDYYTLKLLENIGVILINSSKATLQAIDKIEFYFTCNTNNIQIPKTKISPLTLYADRSNNIEYLKNIASYLNFPIIIKGARFRYINVIDNMEELRQCVQDISNNPYIVQEYITSNEYKVLVLGKEIIGGLVKQRIKGYKQTENFKISGSLKKLSLDIIKKFNLDFGELKFLLLPDKNFLLLEHGSVFH